MKKHMKRCMASVAFVLALAPAQQLPAQDFDNDRPNVRHVLLLSIDGMHAVDFINCAHGIAGANGGMPYCPNLAELAEHGVDYLDASTSKPSDSFPGLMALVSGGSPRSVGAFYDVAYDRSLDPPATTTGNGVAGSPDACVPGAQPRGTTTEFDEGIDIDKTKLNGGAPNGDGGINSIDPKKLERDPLNNCSPVYPWNFVRTNTIFGVVHQAGGYTAWSDKHPSYSSVSGPGDGRNLDDYYSPEINSIPVALPNVRVSASLPCFPQLPDPTATSSSNAWTDSFLNIQCYDTLKVNAIVNEASGFKHDGSAPAPIPTVFGMNFQAVSVGEKLIEKSLNPVVSGGYLDAQGTPSPALLSEIQFVDASIGRMVDALKKSGALEQTLIIVTAKHGQSPIDSARYTRITKTGPVTTSPAAILDNAGCLPMSESPSNPTGIGPTEDDVSLIWLDNTCTTAQAVQMLERQSPANANIAGIGEIFSGPAIEQLFNAPGLPPYGDPRTPDILVTPNVGVTYSGSTSKQAEHGGFAHDDTNVMMLLSNPHLHAARVTSPVETMQVAPTILRALGLNPFALQSVRQEGTEVLPGAF
ncbi:MAG TPA: alkaline phosphatase family protein [Xanthobacteraceae bacterium]|nr:alkaline phosphatase family protein [Xanthobacteraceae bacterium]